MNSSSWTARPPGDAVPHALCAARRSSSRFSENTTPWRASPDAPDLRLVRKRLNPRIRLLGVLSPCFDARNRLSAHGAQRDPPHLPENLLETIVPATCACRGPKLRQAGHQLRHQVPGAQSYLRRARRWSSAGPWWAMREQGPGIMAQGRDSRIERLVSTAILSLKALHDRALQSWHSKRTSPPGCRPPAELAGLVLLPVRCAVAAQGSRSRRCPRDRKNPRIAGGLPSRPGARAAAAARRGRDGRSRETSGSSLFHSSAG
jgi:hypothetical protein